VTHLAAVAGSHVDDETVGFCSYCGTLDGASRRVCTECGLGVQLRTSPGVLRSPGAAFLVVRADGRVSAASAAAERMLTTHGELVGKPLMALLHNREEEVLLARSVALAASGRPHTAEMAVELLGTSRKRAGARAKIASCGQPPAALVLLERA